MKFNTEKTMRSLAILIIIAIILAIVNQVLNLFENNEDGKTWRTVYKTLSRGIEASENGQDTTFVEREVHIFMRTGPVKPSSLPKISTPLDSTMFLVSTYDQYGEIVSRTIYWKDLMKAINEGRIR